MKYFFDTEFIDTGSFIDLISIGIVSEDGGTYYAQSNAANHGRACSWVKENVLDTLDHVSYKPRDEIREQIRAFIGEDVAPQFWAWYGAYDWVCLCQLFGRMLDLPPSWPDLACDVKMLAILLGDPKIPQQVTVKHHALNDAIWTKEVYEFLEKYNAFIS